MLSDALITRIMFKTAHFLGCMGDNHYSEPFAFISQLANSHCKTSQGEFLSTSSTTGNSHSPHLQNPSLLVMLCLYDPARSQQVRL